MRPMLRQLLHDFDEVDAGEEVSPREIGEQVDILLSLGIIGINRRTREGPWSCKHAVLRS